MSDLRALAAALFLLGLMRLGSEVTMGAPDPGAALRLSWRATGARVQVAQAVDLDLPAHMRMPGGNFEWSLLPYRLQVELDGQPRIDRVVRPAGARHDRPLVVNQQIAARPGRSRLRVSFVPAEDAPPEAPRYELDATVEFQAGRALLVTMDPRETTLIRGGRQ
ncbi:MAG: hypothetical protein AB1758_10800 [Candidatus Eremiobacterota bacterium]